MNRDPQLLKYLYQQVDAIYASMAASASASFLESELMDLRVVIRLTVEFADYLQNLDTSSPDYDELAYSCESVFSGINSFSSICAAYSILVGARPSDIARNALSIESLKKDFMSLYHEFIEARDFERRCRLLLDLFKLQIVFAGLLYG